MKIENQQGAKRMFINFREQSTASGDKDSSELREVILKVYEEHDINGNVKWKR